MKKIFTLLLMSVLICSSSAQQDLKPASKNDITYKDGIAYYEGIPFTGLLFEPITKKPIGEFRSGRKHGQFYEYYENGRIKSEGRFNYGTKEGQHIDYYENGNKKLIENYLSDKKNGVFTEFFENGNLSINGNYVQGVLNGELTCYHLNGKTKSVTNYLEGKKVGNHSEWHENGQLKRELSFLGDKIYSSSVIEFDEIGNKYKELKIQNGEINSAYFFDEQRFVSYYNYERETTKEEGLLLNGLKEGLWTEWHPNGQISHKGTYRYGKKDGRILEFSSNGDIVTDINYTNGEINGKGIVLIGSSKYEGEWNMGNKIGSFTIRYFDNSRAEGEYQNNYQEGLWTEYYPNGNKKSIANYSNGKQTNGKYQEWYLNGQLKEEKFLLNSMLHGNYSKFHSNGKVESEIKYQNGKIVDGRYIVYDESGNILSESTFQNGLLMSSYLYKNQMKNGDFIECYPNGSKRVTGYYKNDKRVVVYRYGINRTVTSIIRGIGAIAVLTGVVFLSLAAASI